MAMSEVYFRQLRNVAAAMNDDAGQPDLGDDALIYSGSATWDMWQNHVPQIVVSMWPLFDEETRYAVYVTAKQFTTYNARNA